MISWRNRRLAWIHWHLMYHTCSLFSVDLWFQSLMVTMPVTLPIWSRNTLTQKNWVAIIGLSCTWTIALQGQGSLKTQGKTSMLNFYHLHSMSSSEKQRVLHLFQIFKVSEGITDLQFLMLTHGLRWSRSVNWSTDYYTPVSWKFNCMHLSTETGTQNRKLGLIFSEEDTNFDTFLVDHKCNKFCKFITYHHCQYLQMMKSKPEGCWVAGS